MQNGHTLYLHDVLYAQEVRRNLVFVVVMLQIGTCVNVLLDNVCYRSSFMLDGFIVSDYIPINTNTFTFVTGSSSKDSLVYDVK